MKSKIIGKNCLWIVLFFLAACSLKNQKEKKIVVSPGDQLTTVKFDTMYYNFGNMIQGEQVAYTFRFKNTGASDLVVADAYSTCGCTVANYTRQAVPSDQYGSVEVIFDSTGRLGVQYKNIILKMNTHQGDHTLAIRANVVKK
ncbi:MAG: DUF1573 domain-containing protein [Bacteroidales bacterium]|jgi:hypothetical protein|nr:DUF1573 domain-containing protein [Bacteroidales bacterium]